MILRIWFLSITVLTTSTVNGIYHRGHTACKEIRDGHKCETLHKGEKINCTGGFFLANCMRKDVLKVVNMTVYSWDSHIFSPTDILPIFPKLQKLRVIRGNLSHIVTAFSSSHLETLVLNELLLKSVSPNTFSALINLKILDLKKNQFQSFDSAGVISLPALHKIFLAGNPWNCNLDLSWYLVKGFHEKVGDASHVTCVHPYGGKDLFAVSSSLQAMKRECPNKICNCTMPEIVMDPDTRILHPIIVLNCSHRALNVMPKELPHNTAALYLDHNNITDITPLVTAPSYRQIWDIYLDYNQISDLYLLEGSSWLKTFRTLSLRGNRLRKIPTYAFDDSFEKNHQLGQLYFGDNPWLCDCDFTPAFQQLLIKYGSIVRDISEIKCMEVENDEHSLMPTSNRPLAIAAEVKSSTNFVMELSKGSVCYEPETIVNPLDVVSGVLACLIVLVLGKLAYDYWNFKRTGHLPWIVTKMP